MTIPKTIPRRSVNDLLELAYESDDRQEEFQLLKEAVREADLLGDLTLARHARDKLLDALFHVGDGPALLNTFAWLLADADKHPQADDDGLTLMWRYKWAIATAWSLPNIPLERIEGLINDFETRTQAMGLGKRTANMYRWRLAQHRRDLEEVVKYRLVVKKMRRTFLDCHACDIQNEVSYQLDLGELEAALKAAKPLLTGMASCSRIPARTHAELMLPLWLAGRKEEAQQHHLKGYPLCRTRRR